MVSGGPAVAAGPPAYGSSGVLPSVRSQTAPNVLSELIAVGLTIDELEHIALLEDDPNSPALIGGWFDSKRQVALTIAGSYLAAAIAAFIGDVTIVGTVHGIFSGAIEEGALASLTALTAGCGVAASYYLTKVRRIASRSLQVQHILGQRREKS